MQLDISSHRAFAGRRPLVYAFVVALSYLVLGWIYISFSTNLAQGLATSTEAFAMIERAKGAVFMVVSAALLFGFCYVLFSRLARFTERQLSLQEALLGSERRAMAGMLSMSVVHDWNNLLVAANWVLPELEEEENALSPKGRQMLGRLNKALRDMGELGARMQNAGSRAAASRVQITSVEDFMQEVVILVSHHARVKFCKVQLEIVESMDLSLYPGPFQDALLNMMVNAADATGEQGEICVRLLRQEHDAVLEVHDNGPGVPPNQRDQIFRGFFTTKPGGTGLGLLSVRTCAELHGGQAEVDASPLGGACFRLRLPITGTTSRAA